MDYSTIKENVSYSDCQKCIHEFGDSSCKSCNYYIDCNIEREIDEYERRNDEALNRFYDRLENGEHI